MFMQPTVTNFFVKCCSFSNETKKRIIITLSSLIHICSLAKIHYPSFLLNLSTKNDIMQTDKNNDTYLA
jgi:hypothetical protein